MKRQRMTPSRHPARAVAGTRSYVVDPGDVELPVIEAVAGYLADDLLYLDSMAEVLTDLRLQALPVDVVVADFSLDGADGMALIERLRAEPACHGVILAKAQARESDEGPTIALELFAYTPAPMQLGELELALSVE